MSDSNELESSNKAEDNDFVDMIAALCIITLAVLAGINYVYTGGLSAFFANLM